jgi:D-threo-aldose 1-dehydrogenase
MNRFQQRRIGRTDLQVGVLGLGGAPLGDLYERIPPDRALATLETAYRRGIRLFDTAPLYGQGLSEHRFGHVLREKPRAEFVISTKVGRWLRPERGEQVDRGQFVGGLNFQTVYDYSYDGTMRALEQSYQRLGMDRIDIALIHDVDIWTHGSAEAYERRFRQALEGAYRAPLMNCGGLAWSGQSARGSTRSRPAFASRAKPRLIASCSPADTRCLSRMVSTICCHSPSSKAFHR